MAAEYVIYADESDEKGKFYSDFYGGALVRSKDLANVVATLEAAKLRLGFTREVKWGKVSPAYLEQYKALMDEFFGLLAEDLIKVRIMFTHERFVPSGLTAYHTRNKYQILYYEFLKHAFGLVYSPDGPVKVRLLLDELPCNKEKAEQFKQYLANLGRTEGFRRAGVAVPFDLIAEVRSHGHVVLQCLDIVLGSIQFRLNDKHKEKPGGQRLRGKKTVAKEALYKHINKHQRRMHTNFNIGITTGVGGDDSNRWHQPYRHWVFIANEHEIDDTKSKP